MLRVYRHSHMVEVILDSSFQRLETLQLGSGGSDHTAISAVRRAGTVVVVESSSSSSSRRCRNVVVVVVESSRTDLVA